ncbi:DUF5677 domain-containing protein [Micromonospora sp. BQ11]|uniref:DUF5677 domain-containing protein n=1 Tax=Micromonospora sp. BQ11 TaxID=3452212 RepID=UPI003F895B2C
MPEEEPILLRFINARIKEVAEEDHVDMESILAEATALADELAPEQLSSIRATAASRVAWRRKTSHTVRRKVQRRCHLAIDAYEYLLAVSEEMHARAIDNMVRTWRQDEQEESATGRGAGDSLQGSKLKMFILLSLFARACKTASEVGYLAFGGFPDGALARLRTLYEIVMIHCTLAIAPYEVCERYQAYATIEHLADLREQRRYRQARAQAHDEIDEEIAAAEADARSLYLRYGQEIRRPFEWARQMIPTSSGRITFSDLDRHVSGHGWRTMYLAANHGIHAGPFATVNGIDTEKRYLNSTRPSIDKDGLFFAIRGSVMLMELVTVTFCRQFSQETKDLDECLSNRAVEDAAQAVLTAILSHTD